MINVYIVIWMFSKSKGIANTCYRTKLRRVYAVASSDYELHKLHELRTRFAGSHTLIDRFTSLSHENCARHCLVLPHIYPSISACPINVTSSIDYVLCFPETHLPIVTAHFSETKLYSLWLSCKICHLIICIIVRSHDCHGHIQNNGKTKGD